MKIKPLSDRVLLQRIEEEEVARGGIIIPDTAKEKPQEAEAVAEIPDEKKDAMPGGDLGGLGGMY